MADEQNIDFRLNTQADPKGADDILAKLDALKKRAETLGEEYKKLAEEERKAGEEAEKSAGKMEVGMSKIGKVSGYLTQYGSILREHAGDLKMLSGEQQRQVGVIGEIGSAIGNMGTAAATAFKKTKNPIAAIAAGAGQALVEIKKTYDSVMAEQDEVERHIKESTETIRRNMEMIPKMGIAIAAEEAVKKLNAVIELLDKVQQKEADDREANSKIDDIINPATGGEKSLRDNNRAADQINLAANAALEKVKATADVAAAAEANVKAAMDTFGEQSDRYKDAVKERDDAVELANKAREYAAKLEEAAPRALAELNAKSTETVQEFKDESLKIATENAKELKTALEQILKSQGGSGSPIFTQVLDTVTRLLENGGIDEGEMKEFQTVVNQFRTTSEAQRNRLSETLIKMMQVNQSIIDGLKERDTEINGLLKSIAEWRQSSAADVAALREQIRTMPR